MHERFLLYIDILGFSDLVIRKDRVAEVYDAIDGLNVHRHTSFTAIIFSDTILVYNKEASTSLEEVRYYVMFLCEFAQDLLYRLIGKDIHIRAYLTYGEFEHAHLKNVQAFYGEALVQAYRREKVIQCIGLFMDNELVPYSDVFETSRHLSMTRQIASAILSLPRSGFLAR